MALVRLLADQAALTAEYAPPGLAARLGRSHEIVELNRLHARPDAAGAAKIGNTRLGGHAGASEDHDALGGADQSGQPGACILKFLHCLRRVCFFPMAMIMPALIDACQSACPRVNCAPCEE